MFGNSSLNLDQSISEEIERWFYYKGTLEYITIQFLISRFIFTQNYFMKNMVKGPKASFEVISAHIIKFNVF